MARLDSRNSCLIGGAAGGQISANERPMTQAIYVTIHGGERAVNSAVAAA